VRAEADALRTARGRSSAQQAANTLPRSEPASLHEVYPAMAVARRACAYRDACAGGDGGDGGAAAPAAPTAAAAAAAAAAAQGGGGGGGGGCGGAAAAAPHALAAAAAVAAPADALHWRIAR
jgi:hypothetical protein